ncbi:MAG: PRD domain-containing protein [Candidatus Nanopelagicales bacterium]
MFRIHRVLNNNVVSVLQDGAEVILTGLGIGYRKKPGDLYDPSLAEQRFVIDDAGAGYVSVLVDLSYEMIGLAERIRIYLERNLGVRLTTVQQLALADHIQLAVERSKAGLRLDGALVWELKHAYGAEFAAAEAILELAAEVTGVHLPVEEAAFITTHIVNAELSSGVSGEELRTTNRTTGAVGEIMSMVREGIPGLESGSADYARALTHVKYTVQRVITDSMLRNDDHHLFEAVRAKEPAAWQVTEAIAAYVSEAFGTDLTEDELFYLMLHIGRLRASIAHETASA